jgi:hypothetical protein
VNFGSDPPVGQTVSVSPSFFQRVGSFFSDLFQDMKHYNFWEWLLAIFIIPTVISLAVGIIIGLINLIILAVRYCIRAPLKWFNNRKKGIANHQKHGEWFRQLIVFYRSGKDKHAAELIEYMLKNGLTMYEIRQACESDAMSHWLDRIVEKS